MNDHSDYSERDEHVPFDRDLPTPMVDTAVIALFVMLATMGAIIVCFL